MILVVLAHPRPGSFNHALAERVVRAVEACGERAVVRDLYADGFDPVLPAGETGRSAELPEPIAEACAELIEADGIVIVHPNWWGMPPAVLTGWVDRVFRPGVAYEFLPGDAGEGVPNGLLRAGSPWC